MNRSTMDVVHVVAGLRAKSGKRAALVTALQAIISDVRQEPGCLRYDLTLDRDDPDRVVMLEAWSNTMALTEHEAAAPFQSLSARFDELLSEPVELLKLRQIA